MAGTRADPGARRVRVQAVRATPPLLRVGSARHRGPGPALGRGAGPGRARSQAADVDADGIDGLAPGAVGSARVVPRDPAPVRTRARRNAGGRRRSVRHAGPSSRHHLRRVAPLRARRQRATAAARRDPARVRRREPTGGRRPGAAAGGRRADRRRRGTAHERRPDPDLRAVDRRRAAGADPDVRVAPQHPHRLPARRRRRPGVDHGGAAAVRAGARPDAGDRLDADRRRDRLPDPGDHPSRAGARRVGRRGDRPRLDGRADGRHHDRRRVHRPRLDVVPGCARDGRRLGGRHAGRGGGHPLRAAAPAPRPPAPRRLPGTRLCRRRAGDRLAAPQPPRRRGLRRAGGRRLPGRPADAALARLAGRHQRRRPRAARRDRSRPRPGVARRRGPPGDRQRPRRGGGACG